MRGLNTNLSSFLQTLLVDVKLSLLSPSYLNQYLALLSPE